MRLSSGSAVDELTIQIAATDVVRPIAEYRFHAVRKWRFDLAWPHERIAVEVEGGHAIGGRHVTPSGFRRDVEKYAEAAADGWLVLRVLPEHVRSGAALAWLVRVLDVGVVLLRGHPECLYRTLGDRAPCLVLARSQKDNGRDP